jgi:hypothetical protein
MAPQTKQRWGNTTRILRSGLEKRLVKRPIEIRGKGSGGTTKLKKEKGGGIVGGS